MSQSTIKETATAQAAWPLMPGPEVLAQLNSTPTGSGAEAAERLVGYGPNTLQQEAKPSVLRVAHRRG